MPVEVEVSCARGSARFTIGEIPSDKWLEFYKVHCEALRRAEALFRRSPRRVTPIAFAETVVRTEEAARELVRWGVIDHRPGDFLTPSGPVLYESEEITHAGRVYRVASPRTLQLYSAVNHLFLGDLALEVNKHQAQRKALS